MLLIEPITFEVWKIIDFYSIKENSYKISNFGRVYSILTNKILSPAIGNGYYTIQLSTNDNRRKTFYIHRLVAKAFVYNNDEEKFTEVNHINLLRSDNDASNLEWVEKKENIAHEMRNRNHGVTQLSGSKEWGNGYSTYGENNGMHKFTEAQVIKMLELLELGHSYKYALEYVGLEATTNNKMNLSHIARGHRWKYISKNYNIPKNIPRE